MVRSLAVGFGTLTALAFAGAMTPAGQAVLGQRHAPEQAAPVGSIQDHPAPIPGPAQSLVAAPAAPKAVPAPGRPQVVRTVPRTQPAPPPRSERAQVPPQVAPAQGVPGGLAGVANILLNLPQVLNQTNGGSSPAPGSWSPSQPPQGDQGGRPQKRHRGQGGDQHQREGVDN